MRNVDKFRGSLIGGAAGDALGYSVEFCPEEWIFAHYGQNGIEEYYLRDGLAQISDDTQMTLFTANGLLFGTTRGLFRGIMANYEDYIREMYKCWYRTQTESYPIAKGNSCSWLLNIPQFFSDRSPGATCMSAIRNGAEGSLEKPINDSKGCGGVMRVAPIGLYFCDSKKSYDEIDLLGAKVAALTHGHDLGYIPAAALVHIIRAISEKGSTPQKAVSESIDAMKRIFSEAKHINDFTKLMEKAVELANTEHDDLEAIHQLGEGWVGDEALAIAVYCALKYDDDFDKALRASVNHGGDSDSTGSITGNILGAYIGYEAIPKKYKENLEFRDLIIEIADDLYNDCPIDEYTAKDDDIWLKKYIYANYSPLKF